MTEMSGFCGRDSAITARLTKAAPRRHFPSLLCYNPFAYRWLHGRIGLKDVLTRIYPANYDAHARTVAPNGYWQQVRRTVNGKPISETQIMLIVKAITIGLSLNTADIVLDLACGNGALSSYLFDECA